MRKKLYEARRGLPLILKNEAVNYAMDAFKKQGWEGTPWPARSKRTKGKGRALLVKTGRLKRSIGAYSHVESEERIILGSDVPYAKIHNFGGVIDRAARSETFSRNRRVKGIGKGRFRRGVTKGRGFSFKAHQIRIPRRQFLGDTPKLKERLIKVGQAYILKSIK